MLRGGTTVRAVGKDGTEVTFSFHEGRILLLHSLLSWMGRAHGEEDMRQNPAAFSSPSQMVRPWCCGCQHIPKPYCHVSQCANIPWCSPAYLHDTPHCTDGETEAGWVTADGFLLLLQCCFQLISPGQCASSTLTSYRDGIHKPKPNSSTDSSHRQSASQWIWVPAKVWVPN